MVKRAEMGTGATVLLTQEKSRESSRESSVEKHSGK